MQARMKHPVFVIPDAMKALHALNQSAEKQLPFATRKLIHLRASQINGCSACVDMHSQELKKAGETDQRVFTVAAWRETPFYDERERAALAGIEAVTLVSQTHVPGGAFEQVQAHFTEQEIVDLTFITATINAWNRLAISLRSVPGRYRAACG